MEIEVGLPVSFNLKFISLEADISYILPTYTDAAYPAPKGFVLMFSAYFKIFLSLKVNSLQSPVLSLQPSVIVTSVNQ